jgi:hypothetical protein
MRLRAYRFLKRFITLSCTGPKGTVRGVFTVPYFLVWLYRSGSGSEPRIVFKFSVAPLILY